MSNVEMIKLARLLFVEIVGRIDDESDQREAIGQLLVDLMDVTEQSMTGQMVIEAHDGFDRLRREQEGIPLPPPLPPPPHAATLLPPEQQVICRTRIELELLGNGTSNVWIDAGHGSTETPILGLPPTDVALVAARQNGERTIRMVVAGERHIEVIGANIEAARRRA
jgi:hypothetical protein